MTQPATWPPRGSPRVTWLPRRGHCRFPHSPSRASGRSRSELSVRVLPLRAWEQRFEHVPVLDHLAVDHAIEVIKAGRLVVEQALVHDEHSTAFAEDPMHLVHLVDKAWLGEWPLLSLGAGLVVFAIAVVLMELVSVLERLIPLPADHHDLEIFVGQRLIGFGFVSVCDVSWAVGLGPTAAIRSRALGLNVVPVFDNQPVLKSED